MPRYEVVDLSEEEASLQVEEKKEVKFPDLSETLKPAFEKLTKEIEALELGTSVFRKGAIQFPKGICFPDRALKGYRSQPTKENLQGLFSAVKQDLGARVHDAFIEWCVECVPNLGELLRGK